MTVAELKAQIAGMPDEWPVYFRRIAPFCGSIESAGSVNADQYSFFGKALPCAIIEPVTEDEEGTDAH